MSLSASRLSTALRAAMIATVEGASDNAAMTALCNAIATAVVNEITGNAEAVISVTTGALQTSTAPGAPTGPPAPLEQTIPIR